MSYYKVEDELLYAIEEEFNVKFNMTQANIFCLINSFNRMGSNCTMSQSAIGKRVRCSYKTVSRTMDKLSSANLITIYRPKGQMTDKLVLTYHISKKVKQFINDWTQDKMSDKLSTYINNNRVVSQPSLDDGCSTTELKETKDEKDLINIDLDSLFN